MKQLIVKSMIVPRSTFIALTTFLAAVPALTLPGHAQDSAMVVAEYKSWSLNHSRSGSHNMCYVTANPNSKIPETANRSEIAFYVSSWPKDGVRSEISVKFGYPVDPQKKVTVSIGSETFTLTPKKDRAFLYDATAELKLVEAMKRGSTMIVEAVSTRGTKTIDTYLLGGVTSALNSMAKSCS